MAKQDFLQLAQKYTEKKSIGGFCYSEKLDGFRVFWDGGVTTGMHSSKVPWANTTKDHIHVTSIRATGLWSRYGNVVHAPEHWIAKLPPFPLDGELYIGRGTFQELRSIASKYPANRIDSDWDKIKFMVFSLPKMTALLGKRTIDTINFQINIPDTAYQWWSNKYEGPSKFLDFSTSTFRRQYFWLVEQEQNDVFRVHRHYSLPTLTKDAVREAQRELDTITTEGGEGIMLRDPWSMWVPERCHSLLKMKKLHDAEGVVVGFKSGTETDKGSKLLGLIGAVTLKYINELGQEVYFDISGFTNEERAFADGDAMSAYAASHPGEVMPPWVESKHFPRGSTLTFRYRELSKDGVPKEARFFRA